MARLLYFGRLEDALGLATETLTLPSDIADTSALRTWLDSSRQRGGALVELTVRIALNDQIVSEPCPVTDADEIAFLPPVGGG